MKHVIAIILFILIVPALFGKGKYKEEDFIGVWFFVDSNEQVDSQQWLMITKENNGLIVCYSDGSNSYSGILELTPDGRYLKGVLSGLGGVVIGKIQSKSQFKNNGIGLDLSGGPDDILLGYFQKKEVLEKLLGKKLPLPR